MLSCGQKVYLFSEPKTTKERFVGPKNDFCTKTICWSMCRTKTNLDKVCMEMSCQIMTPPPPSLKTFQTSLGGLAQPGLAQAWRGQAWQMPGQKRRGEAPPVPFQYMRAGSPQIVRG